MKKIENELLENVPIRLAAAVAIVSIVHISVIAFVFMKIVRLRGL